MVFVASASPDSLNVIVAALLIWTADKVRQVAPTLILAYLAMAEPSAPGSPEIAEKGKPFNVKFPAAPDSEAPLIYVCIVTRLPILV